MTDKKLKLEFAPGCFDDFAGSQEELDALVAALAKMMEDGTLFKSSFEVPLEDAEAIWEKLSQTKPRS